MAPIPEATYQRLDEMFEALKRISRRPSGDKEVHEKALQKLKEQFDAMKTFIDEQLRAVAKEADHDDWIKLTVMKGSLSYEEGKINLGADCLEEARDNMRGALDALKGVEAEPLVCYLHQRVVNHLGFILSKLGDLDAAKTILKEVLAAELPAEAITFTTEELFALDGIASDDSTSKMHSIYINNLQMLSWIYSKMGLETESAAMQHTILEKEMEFGDCDPVDWAMRCTRVASLYLVRKQFVASRYYLSAATSAIERIEGQFMDHHELGKAQAELARGWIYYGLKLFDVSRTGEVNQMCTRIFDEIPTVGPGQAQQAQETGASNEEPCVDDAIKFQNSEVNLANVPAKPVRKVAEARHLFQHTQVWLKRARVFYTLRDYPYLYVNCVLDLSELYRFLAFYEPDLETQYSVQKKRGNALETLSSVLKEVRPQCYVAVSVDLLREMAEVQLELLAINLKKMYKAQVPNAGSVKHRMESIYQIHHRLESVGNLFSPTVQGQANGNGKSDAADVPNVDAPPDACLTQGDAEVCLVEEAREAGAN